MYNILWFITPISAAMSGVALTPFCILIMIVEFLRAIKTFSVRNFNLSTILLLVFLMIRSPMNTTSIIVISLISLSYIVSKPNVSWRFLVYGIIAADAFSICQITFEFTIKSLFYKISGINGSTHFAAHFMDRAVVVTTVFFFPVFFICMRSKLIAEAIIMSIMHILLMYISDSLASTVAFIVSVLVIIFIRLRFLIKLIIPISSLCFLVAINTLDKSKIGTFDFLPDSAVHRLFIWKETFEHLDFWGYGVDSSRKMNFGAVKYKNYNFDLMPLHPHNSTLQILLELGVIGYILTLLWIMNIKISPFNYIIYMPGMIAYYVISSISFGIFQTWWLCVGVLLSFLIKGSSKYQLLNGSR